VAKGCIEQKSQRVVLGFPTEKSENPGLYTLRVLLDVVVSQHIEAPVYASNVDYVDEIYHANVNIWTNRVLEDESACINRVIAACDGTLQITVFFSTISIADVTAVSPENQKSSS